MGQVAPGRHRVNLRLTQETYDLLAFIAAHNPGMTATGFAGQIIEEMRPALQQLADTIRAMQSDQPRTALDKLNAMYQVHEEKGAQFQARMKGWEAEVAAAEAGAAQPGGAPAAEPQGAARAGQR